MEEKRQIQVTLKTAKKWYNAGGPLKDLALSAFTKEELVDPIVWDYDKLLEKYAEKYPIGTIIWANNGTEYFPNVIMSLPYTRDIDPWYKDSIKKEIVFDTKCICLSTVKDSHICFGSKSEFSCIGINKCRVFDYDKWKNDTIKRNKNKIECIQGDINHYEKQIQCLRNEIEQKMIENTHFDELYNEQYGSIKAELNSKHS